MKILHITKKYPKALGGDAVVVSNLEKQQRKNHDQVVILTSNCDEIKTGKHIYKFGLKDTPAALDTITPRRLLSLASLVKKSFQVIRRERPDVVHTHSVDMAFATSFATRWYKIPMVHTFHVLTFPDKNQSWLRRKSELLFKKGARPRIVTAPDEADVQHLQKAGASNATLLPNGIDLNFWRKRDVVENDVFTFVTVGRLEEQKGHTYLIKAAALLKETCQQPFKIIIVGAGSLQEDLEAQAQEHDVIDCVSFVGRKTPQEVRSLYATSDAAVFPSLWEAAALTIYEAWAMELPIVTTRSGIFQEEATDSERVEIVELRDAPSLARGMERVITDADRRQTLARTGNEVAQAHAWSKVHEVAHAIYNQALTPVVSPAPAVPPPIMPVVVGEMPPMPPVVRPPKIWQSSERNILLALTLASIASLGVASSISSVLNTFITLPLAIIVPGLLLRLAAFRNLGGKTLTATLSLATALGLLLITFESLALNWILPLIGLDKPLQTRYIVPTHIITMLALLVVYLTKYRVVAKDTIVKLHISMMQIVRFVVPLLLPLLATAGAFRQNNGFGNQLTVLTIALMAGLAAWFVLKPKAFNPLWLLFNIALGLLLTTSMRSWFVSGFDISQEFQVFTLTLQNHHWDLNAIPGNAYNACLSLTTLPTALQQMVGITPEYIFKFFYQISFALTAVVMYLLGRRFADTRGAFLVGLLYVAQAQFIGTMPFIVRQELGLLFFSLIIYLLLEKGKMSRARAVLLGLLSIGMVVSHYSTTYIAIFMLVSTATILWALKIRGVRQRLPKFRPVLSALSVSVLALTLMGLSYAWYSGVNSSSSNVTKTISASWHAIINLDITNGYSIDQNGQRTRLLLGGDRETSKPEDVADYKSALGIKQAIQPASAETLPVKNHAATLAADHVRDVLAITFKLLLPISPFLLLVFKKTRTQVADISFLSVGTVITFVAFMFLPILAQSYNIERVLQQALIILSLTGLWALWVIVPAGKIKFNTIVTAAFVLVFFVFSPGTGLVNQLIGGTAPRMNMNSTGEEYAKYYFHDSEVQSARWLGEHCSGQAVWADRYATLRVTAYAGIPYDDIRSDILTAKNGCIMLDEANTQKNLYYASYKTRPVRYTMPAGAFDAHNLIYSNGASKVYGL
jgi:uncharacterized membrane protein/glycosyltransferase involved in cell wall biosynthesis